MREFREYGSARGALSNERPYRDPNRTSQSWWCWSKAPTSEARTSEMFTAVEEVLRESPEVGAYN